MRRLLEPTRTLWERGRPAGRLARWRLQPRCPAWTHTDPLLRQLDARDPLLRVGRVVWGAVVQANVALYEPGRHDHPAGLVYGPGEDYTDLVPALTELARELYLLKDTTPEGEDLRELAQAVTDELSRPARLRVPERLTRGPEAYLTTALLHRAHLPGGRLRGRLLPLLVAPEVTPWTFPLPGAFWSPELLAAWRDA
ncbi:MAG: hypothetical protein R3F62_13570 [Planctomycetota bacterium]